MVKVVVGAANIAATFSAVIEVFDYVQLGRRFEWDYQRSQRSQLKLTLLRLHLSRWGEAVDVYKDPQLGKPSATLDELKAAKDTLIQILGLFEDSRQISKKFKDAAGSPRPVDAAAKSDLTAVLAVENKMRALAKEMQKGSSFPWLMSWTIRHSTAVETLIADISALARDLETLFPAPEERIKVLKEREVEMLGEDEKEAFTIASNQLNKAIHGTVAAAAGEGKRGRTYRGVDISCAAVVANGNAYYGYGATGQGSEMPSGAAAVGEGRRGHTYRDVVIRGAAVVVNNDYSATGRGAEMPSGSGHLYDGIKIEGNGQMVVLNGDSYGGVDPFAVTRG